MTEKTALVTGANSGMGLATSAELVSRGYRVLMACRSRERGEEALRKVEESGGPGSAELVLCDLGDLASIRRFSDEVHGRISALDVLINNAGVVSPKRRETKDGFELALGVNHLGHFLSTNLLLDLVHAAEAGRIIVVASGAYKAGQIYFPDPHLRENYNVIKSYGQSKLANILFARELALRTYGTSTTVNALHPGAVLTQLGINRKTGFGQGVYKALGRLPSFQTPEEGASTAVYLADSPDVAGISREYFYRSKPHKLDRKAENDETAARLWEWSEREVGLD
ncbi:SDR family oxidoreductase [Saccharibacillus sp. CPCC 101409]|uniref:SDR family oxidoreductase n=1 Tax=Saccharibacillus sp. CPCC 101409 TaxID=3058041 RepID=UPI00267156F0|nr:SDR family oxidoreductase [Saccharibacillus sp. CPCC 101409]MDO3409066.1 SDR family oxidoreductase [Saccharibacillus sp. CPCC 101409]